MILYKLLYCGKLFGGASFETARVVEDKSRQGAKADLIIYIVQTALPVMRTSEHQQKRPCEKRTSLWPLIAYRSTRSELRIANIQTQRTWPVNNLPSDLTSASSMEASASLSRIVVFPAFARPKIRIRNSKSRIFQNDKSLWSEISSLEGVPVSEAIEGRRTEGST